MFAFALQSLHVCSTAFAAATHYIIRALIYGFQISMLSVHSVIIVLLDASFCLMYQFSIDV